LPTGKKGEDSLKAERRRRFLRKGVKKTNRKKKEGQSAGGEGEGRLHLQTFSMTIN